MVGIFFENVPYNFYAKEPYYFTPYIATVTYIARY